LGAKNDNADDSIPWDSDFPTFSTLSTFIVAMFEADSIEAVRDFVIKAGLMAWNDLKINPVTPVSETMDNIDKAPPTIF
jgi:hypothetical protein